MLNYELQLSILKAVSSTYTDDKRTEISSKDFDVSAEEFIANVTYLKREKLIDISSLSTRSSQTDDTNYSLVRVTITHAGMKVLAELTANKIITNPYL